MSFDFSSFEKAVTETKDWLTNELGKIRSGRVSGSMLNDITAEVYGEQTPLEQLASIGNEGPRTLRLNVYDASQINTIEKALQQADLGASIAKDDSGLRLNFPEMTEKNRQAALDRAKEKLEQARVSLREKRQEVMQAIEDQEDAGDISEDEMYRYKETLNEKMRNAKEALEQLVEDKREELSV